MEKDEFVSYEQAVALKELGVYIAPPCYTVYRKYDNIDAVLIIRAESMETIDLVAPLKSQVFRWFDENTSYQGFVTHSIKEEHFDWYIINYDDVSQGIECIEYYSSRQEAESACISKLLELTKQ